MILDDIKAKGSRRRALARQLISQLSLLAEHNGIQVRSVSRLAARRLFGDLGAVSKHRLACAIAEKFPELASRLPPERKPSRMPEDAGMGIFDAAFALALTIYKNRKE